MTKNRRLPIKVFEKRENIDERFTEGGGGNPPKWILKGEELHKKANVLLEDLNNTKGKIKSKFKEFQEIPTVIRAKINEDAIAKSHRKDLNTFLTANKNNNRFIGVSTDQELLIRVDNFNQLIEIDQNIQQFKRNDKAISGIESIDAFEPEIEVNKIEEDKNGKYLLKIQLFDFNNYQLNDVTLKVFKDLIETKKDIKFIKTVKYTERLYLHEISVDSLDSLKAFENFSPVMSIEPMPTIEVVEDDFFLEKTMDIPKPKDDMNYPIVGVLDSGIADIPQLNSWKYGKRHSNYPSELLNVSHGTFVAGIINFGDILEEANYTGTSNFKLLDAAVVPNQKKESITEGDLINNIREVIENNQQEVKIWNLSLGTDQEIKNSEFSKLGIALDSIQDENDVLIIKSAGNCGNFLKKKPISKIAGGADSVRALTVGSIAQSKKEYDIAGYNYPSPFSRIGPGPVNIIKPEFVHYGGNYGLKDNKHIANGVCSFSVNGGLTTNVGTSFSTPRVTAIAADLNGKLNEDFDSILLKALLIHSAKYPNEVDLPINEKLNQLGFGIPNKPQEILYNNPHEITLILRDTLNKGEFIEILDFPFPSCLIDNGYYYGQISLTMVNHPILQEGQGPEYCQSDLQVYFGTYDNKKMRDISVPTIKNPIGRDGGKNILTSNIYSKRGGATEGFTRSEKLLVQYGNKYYPNKKYSIDLNELTATNKERYLKQPKNWYLKLEGVYRDFIEGKAEYERMDLAQEFCTIITLKDPSQTKPVYNEVSQLLENNNFIHRNIKVRQDINISLD
ncbi:S8 family peptidase [Bacillus spizizenii]|uniref:S8 family peptidase n=1 Tax=Bacillus spizizenii TaxID=96241 RepID=UPI002DB7C8A7|nr:S8 family peptidase [Bacillus spizizenii]MEC2182774.1 S8 family peptidase [Bacillus spizizenii]